MLLNFYQYPGSIICISGIWKMWPGDKTGGPWMHDIGEKWTGGQLGEKFTFSKI